MSYRREKQLSIPWALLWEGGRESSARGFACWPVMYMLLCLAQPARVVWGAGEQLSEVKKALRVLKWGHKSYWRCVRLCSCLSKHTSRCMRERGEEVSATEAWRHEGDWKFWSGVVRKTWVYCRGCLSENSYSCYCSKIVCIFCGFQFLNLFSIFKIE